jgi:hypothetical protein
MTGSAGGPSIMGGGGRSVLFGAGEAGNNGGGGGGGRKPQAFNRGVIYMAKKALVSTIRNC